MGARRAGIRLDRRHNRQGRVHRIRNHRRHDRRRRRQGVQPDVEPRLLSDPDGQVHRDKSRLRQRRQEPPSSFSVNYFLRDEERQIPQWYAGQARSGFSGPNAASMATWMPSRRRRAISRFMRIWRPCSASTSASSTHRPTTSSSLPSESARTWPRSTASRLSTRPKTKCRKIVFETFAKIRTRLKAAHSRNTATTSRHST